jgi:hypothetical protein
MARFSRYSPAGVAAALFLVLGCGGGDGSDGGGGSGDDGPDFSVAIAGPAAVEVPAGGDEVVFVQVTGPEGVGAPTVYLHLEGLPPGVSAEVEQVPAGSVEGAIWLIAADDAPPVQNVETRVVAETAGGHASRETTLLISVIGPDPHDPLDPGFGIGGVASAIVGDGPTLTDVLVLADGSIVAVGGRADGHGFVAKWDSTGFPDPEFNSIGTIVFSGFIPAVATAGPSGTILLGGLSTDLGVPALALLDGASFDADFGTRPMAGSGGQVLSLATFGSVVAASSTTAAGHVLARLDLSSQNVYPPGNDGPPPRVSAFAADGSVVAATNSAVVRFDPDGNWDTSFADEGRLSIGAQAIGAVLPTGSDGGFLVGGAGTDDRAFVTRVVGDGIDPAFADDLRWSFDSSNVSMVTDLVALRDGAAAIAYESPSGLLSVVLFDPAGGVRAGYGDQGVIRLPYLAQKAPARLALEWNGDVIAGFVGGPDFVALVRVRR